MVRSRRQSWTTSEQQKRRKKGRIEDLLFVIIMKVSTIAFGSLFLVGSACAFSVLPSSGGRQQICHGRPSTVLAMSEAATEAAPAPTSEMAEVEVPTNLPSDCGMDYIPLATMLATGQLAEADQVRGQRVSFRNISECLQPSRGHRAVTMVRGWMTKVSNMPNMLLDLRFSSHVML